MSVISISLPAKQVKQLDQLVKQHDFANRSELIRSVLRLLKHKPEVLHQADELPFHVHTDYELDVSPEFEKQILEAAAEPIDYSNVLETEEDIDRYFDEVVESIRHENRN